MSTPIIKQYKKIKQDNLDCLLFFRLGDFYELFFQDAEIAAKELNITLTKRPQKNEDIPMAGVPYHTSDYYIAKLVKAGYKIAICEQIGTELNADKIINREVVKIITSGTITDDCMLDTKRNNFLMSIHDDNYQFSIAVYDLSTNEFFIEDIDKIQLKSIIEKFNPSEILIPQTLIPKFLDQNIDEKLLTTIQAINKFHAENIIMDFFNLHSKSSINYLNDANLITAANIIEYIKHTQKKAQIHIDLPKKNSLAEEVELDAYTRRNLEITKTLQNNKKGSLLSFLDETCTAQGGRKLYHILTHPIQNIQKLNERLDNIEFFFNNPNIHDNTLKMLKSIPDFERILTKIIFKKATPKQVLELAQGCMTLYQLCLLIHRPIDTHNEIFEEIIQAISEDAPNSLNTSTKYIKKNYLKELDDWKDFTKDIHNQINTLQTHYQKMTNLPYLKIKNTPLGFLVEINNNYKEKLNTNFELRQSLKTYSRYSTQALDVINLKFTQSTNFIYEKEKEIFYMLCNKVGTIANSIAQYSEISASIDVYSTLALIAKTFNHIRPKLTEDNVFEIIEGRHPILEKTTTKKGLIFVPNNCVLSPNIMFITGPNMAGKSTYLRQQALICLMAHCGTFVPCKSATIGIVDQIFSRISTNDDITQGNSTFMIEMIEMALTLNQATSKSFLILDEVGRGTSVEEGEALAEAIIDYLANHLHARVLFATHYLSLGKIKHPNIQQQMMEITLNPLTFKYKVNPGIAEKSYALEVAKIAGMPFSIIEKANSVLKSNHRK